ncbi:hypothetical protein [Nostoc sp. CALU 1950]|uniref:hypothetical protein n=1 Tax=Nostoc sp. CALU 1950 TaxID=3104321 RepID=UPI003EBA1F90
MSYLNQRSKPALDYERSEVLQQLEDWLETPMLVLGFAWLGLFIVELVWGLNPLLEASLFQRGLSATRSRVRQRCYHLDRLYRRFWDQISPRSSQNFLPST